VTVAFVTPGAVPGTGSPDNGPETMKELSIPVPGKPFFLATAFVVVAATVALLASPYYALALLPSLAVAVLLLVARFPQAGYFLIVLLIPMEVFRELSPAHQWLTISKAVGLWVVVVLGLSLVVNRGKRLDIKSDLWVWLLLFFVVGLVSALLSSYRPECFNALRKLLIAYVFVALTMIFVASRKSFARSLPLVLVLGVSISAFLSILGYAFNLSQFAMSVGPDVFDMRRATGAAGSSPNVLCYMMVLILPLVSHFFFAARRWGKRLFWAAVFVMNVVATILTYTRVGAVVMVIVLLLVLWQNRGRLTPVKIGFALGLVAIAITAFALLLPATYRDRIRSSTNLLDASIQNRLSYLHAGWDAFKSSPVVGTGLGSFPRVYADSQHALTGDYETALEARRAAHNTYLAMLAGTGVLGFVIYIAILAVAFKGFGKTIRQAKLRGETEMGSITAAYRTAFVAALLFQFTGSNQYDKLFWISIALSQVALLLSRSPREETADETAAHTG